MFTGMLNRAHKLEAAGVLRLDPQQLHNEHSRRSEPHPPTTGTVRLELLPGYSDQLALKLGLLDTTLPIDSARSVFLINGRSDPGMESVGYSRAIRRAR